MKRNPAVWITLFFVAALLVAIGTVAPNLAMGAQAQEVGSAFTYQGRLEYGGVPADGLYDLHFELYDDPDAGTLLGAVTVEDHSVDEGFFTVQLDFGEVFDGDARWLQIGIRPGDDTGAYTSLSPRQALTPAPYALYAAGAPWSGLTDVPADLADGDDVGLTSVEWADVLSRPVGLDDGDDDTTYSAGTGLVLAGTQFSAEGSPYANVVVVAQSGGDFSSVQAALNVITDASASNPYLIYVAPGLYEEQIFMRPYVDIEGAGEGITVIRFTGSNTSPSTDGSSATVLGADNASLRFLSVQSDGTGQSNATAIYNDGASPRLLHVTATASGATGSNAGVYNVTGSPTMIHVTASAVGGSPWGVYNLNNSTPRMENVTATASGGDGTFTIAVHNDGGSPIMKGVTAIASDGANINVGVWNDDNAATTMENVTASASGGDVTYAVFNQSDATPTMTNVRANASEGTNLNYAVRNSFSSPAMNHVIATAEGGNQSYGVAHNGSLMNMNGVTATASGSSSSSYGLYISSSGAVVTVTHSILQGDSSAIRVLNGATGRIGTSQLMGGANNAGTLNCVLSYDETFAELNASCE